MAREFAAVKPRFGYVPDVENHFDEFTAGQNLRIYADLYRTPRPRIDECLEMVELRREKDIPVRAFSKGMRKKLLLARELLHEPELLLLDEPTANLDVHSTELIRHIIQRLAKRERDGADHDAQHARSRTGVRPGGDHQSRAADCAGFADGVQGPQHGAHRRRGAGARLRATSGWRST